MAGLLYVQPDGEIFVDTQHDDYPDCREFLMQAGSLVRRQEPLHVYQLTPLGLWQAAAAGWTPKGILTLLRTYCDAPLPLSVQQLIVAEMSKWGACRFVPFEDDWLELLVSETYRNMISMHAGLKGLGLVLHKGRFLIPLQARALARQVLIKEGIPVQDQGGYGRSAGLPVQWRPAARLRPYQQSAVDRFFGDETGQSGIILMPCGAGKTMTGVAILTRCAVHTLIVAPGESAANQWIRACLAYTSLTEEDVAMYHAKGPIAPVTVTTYQKISGRTKNGTHQHLERLSNHPFGLVIYDEVHMLPAPLFRLAAQLHSVRRLGLTATLVREDGAEDDVYALVGPKCFEASPMDLAEKGFLSSVSCIEVRVPLDADEQTAYRQASAKERYRIAGCCRNKAAVTEALMARHQGRPTLIMGHYLDGLTDIARRLGLPLITGETPQSERERLFQSFRSGAIHRLALSRVANMAIDLPDATIGIQLSGLYGSRQEEAQRLGRLLRPKEQDGVFYTLIAQDTVEVHTARKRQMFLAEQGYRYDIDRSFMHKGVMLDEIVGVSQ